MSTNESAAQVMTQQYELEKWIWTEADFEVMGWHDCKIYSAAFLGEYSELAFDIDYIFEWIHPQPDETYFKFWVAPATLVFKNVYDVELDTYDGNLEIDDIKREDESRPKNADFIGKTSEWLWTIECQEGDIRFRSVGYEQFIREPPQLIQEQTLDRKTNEISFARGRTGSDK